MFDCKNTLNPNQICTAIRCRSDDTDECCKCQAVSQQDLPGQQLARSTYATLPAVVAILGEMSILIGCRITKQHSSARRWVRRSCGQQSIVQTKDSHTHKHLFTLKHTVTHRGSLSARWPGFYLIALRWQFLIAHRIWKCKQVSSKLWPNSQIIHANYTTNKAFD